MKQRTLTAVLLVVCATQSLFGVEPDVERLHAILDESWEFDIREDPLFATHAGDHRYDDKLPDESLAAIERRLAYRRQLSAKLTQLDRATLPREEQINYDMFLRGLQDDLAEADFHAHLMPITNRSGFHIEFPELRLKMPFKNVRDYENYIARLQAFAKHATDQIELLRQGAKEGLTIPAVTLEGFREPIVAHLVDDPEKSLFYEPFVKFPANVPAAEQARLRDAGKAAIAASVVTGYRAFLDFMQSEYVPKSRSSVGAAALPRGRDFYQHRVKRFTTLDLAPEQVHETGLSEVKRIRAEMLAIVAAEGFGEDFDKFVQHLRSDEKYYAKTPEELLKETSLALKRMDGQLPKLFKTLPRTPYGIREIPAYIAPRTTTAYYQQPGGDGASAGFYYVNTYNLRSRPLYEIEALSLHEAVPGHHLQLALQQEQGAVPMFRRFGGVTAFVEGWGLYAERLGLETGFYQARTSDFGRLSYEMWRACRLVVDTGMHYLGWTREQAIAFMAQNTALSLHNITAEVDRYIAWPGQALAYKIGELKIRQLRALAEKELGAKFDVREFHDVVLANGAVPLTILEENVRLYVQRESKK